jgi:hypothetical protein
MARAELGAAQKDMARELGAKRSNLKGVVWGGVAIVVCCVATLFYPPLRLLIGSVTTSLAVLVGGVSLTVQVRHKAGVRFTVVLDWRGEWNIHQL